MDCGFHAREWISHAFCQWFVNEVRKMPGWPRQAPTNKEYNWLQHKFFCNLPQAVTAYGSVSQMTSLLDQMDVFVLPVFNIDGYVFTHTNVRYNPFKLKLFALVKRRHPCAISRRMHLMHICMHFGNFRTGCGEKLAPGTLDPAALGLIQTETSMLAGAVSMTYEQLNLRLIKEKLG